MWSRPLGIVKVVSALAKKLTGGDGQPFTVLYWTVTAWEDVAPSLTANRQGLGTGVALARGAVGHCA